MKCFSKSRQSRGRQLGPQLRILILAVSCLSALPTIADEATCGTLRNAVGPFDFRTPNVDMLRTVEDYHFTLEVESLKKGATGQVGGDIDYVLRAFPNHPRALAAMVALRFKSGTDRPLGAKWPVPCYFERAVRFVPDDGRVRTIYGVYLLRLDRPAEAIEEFKSAATLGEDGVNLHYNAGLAYFDIGDYALSLEHAKKAYALGLTLPGLRNKLEKAGKWTAD